MPSMAFPIADGWYGSVGGFYRESDGVRVAAVPADDGGQFTATLNHDLDDGSFLLWGRALDDKNQFIVPVPLIENAIGSFSALSRFQCAQFFLRQQGHTECDAAEPGGWI